MEFEFTAVETFGIAMIVLFVGNQLSSKIQFLQRYNIPDPVVGGLVFSVLSALLYTKYDFSLAFNVDLRDTMMLAFFSTVGLNANAKLLKAGGLIVARFLIVSALFLCLQDCLGLLLAKMLSLPAEIGLLAGSITLAGGHGTGAIYAMEFNHIPGAMEIAMACATCGLVLGGILGGPLAEKIIHKHKLAPEDRMLHPWQALKQHGLNEQELVTGKTMLEILFLLALCIVLAKFTQIHLVETPLKRIPTFVFAMFYGIFFTNLFEFSNVYKVPTQTVDLIALLSLSIFLAIALMSLKIWQLLNLAGPLLLIIAIQSLLIILYVYFITFRFMGKNYEAAVISSGHIGSGLGATPTAVANMETIVFRYGPAPQAFMAVPLVGSFFIDFINAGIIQLFLNYFLER